MKTALITGASRGIGAACALLFAGSGYQVAVNYNKSEDAAFELVKQTNQAYPRRAFAVKADVAQIDSVREMVLRTQEFFGKIDILINNAGVASQQMFCDLDEREWNRVFDINAKGTYLVTQAVLPGMVERKTGAIVNISSVWGVSGASCEAAYSASKAAVIGLTKALAKELGPSGIRVNCIAPGVIQTDMNSALTEEIRQELKEETALNRLGSPEDIAQAALFFADERAGFITGQILGANGGFLI